MKRLIYSLLVLWFVSSCDFIEPTVSGYSNFNLGKLEGKTLNVNFDVTVNNENGYGFKLKHGNLHVLVNDQDIGTIELNDKIKVKRKSERVYNVPLKLSLSDGAMFRIMKLVNVEKYELKLDGKVRGTVWGFGRTFDVHETRSLSSGDIKFDGLLKGILKGTQHD